MIYKKHYVVHLFAMLRASIRTLVGLALYGVMLASAPAFAQDGRVYRLAHDSGFMPFSGVKDGASVGLSVDILKAAAKRANVLIEMVPVSFAERIDAVKSGKVDGIFPFPDSAEFRAIFDFSKPLVLTGGALFVLKPQATPEGLEAMNGQVVITPKAGPLAAYIQQKAPLVKLGTTQDYKETLEMLIGGKAAAAALNLQVGTQLVNQQYRDRITVPEKSFFELPLAVGVIKGTNSILLQKINAALSEMNSDGSMKVIGQTWR